MRRRQATSDGDHGGIFVIASPDIPGESKHGRRQRKGLLSRSSLLSLGALVVCCAVYLLVLKKQVSIVPSSSALNSIVDTNTIIGSNNDAASSASRAQSRSASASSSSSSGGGILPITAAVNEKDLAGHDGIVARPPMTRTTTTQPPRIPRRLIFTYKYNLIAPSRNDPPFDVKAPLTANVLRTIDKYQKYWDDMDDASSSSASAKSIPKREEVVVSFLSDDKCLEVIAEAEPRLVDHFFREKRGEYKADICRVAELYLHGGYYFDIDIGVVEPIDLDALHLPSAPPNPIRQLQLDNDSKKVPNEDDIATFVTVYNGQGRFFQAFTAATPRHPVLKRSLDYMIAFYEESMEKVLPQYVIDFHMSKHKAVPSRRNSFGMGVGPYTLSVAHRTTTDEEWEEYVGELKRDTGYYSDHEADSNGIRAKERYARFLYEISLEDEEVKKQGIFQNVPLQDAKYQQKVHWCNFVCFGGHKVYFYSRVPGSKGCPEERRLSPPYH